MRIASKNTSNFIAINSIETEVNVSTPYYIDNPTLTGSDVAQTSPQARPFDTNILLDSTGTPYSASNPLPTSSAADVSSIGLPTDTPVTNYTATATLIAAAKGLIGTNVLNVAGNTATTLAISGTAAQTGTISAGIYSFWSTVACFFLVDVNPTATTANGYPIIQLNSNITNVINVYVPASDKVSVITSGSTGTFSYFKVA